MFPWLLTLGCSPFHGDGDGTTGDSEPGTTDDSTDTDDTEDPRNAVVFDGDRPKNLLVITLDTARRDYTGFFDSRGLAPNLTSSFSSGVILADHHSCSNWTTPSFTCAQTGRFPLDDGFWPSGLSYPARDVRIDWPPPDLETIAGILTAADFRTELVTTNSMFSLEFNGGAYGFQKETRAFDANATTAVDLAIASGKVLETTSDRWYLHVHFMDPHGPFGAPTKFLPNPSLDCSAWDLTTELALNEVEYVTFPKADKEQQAAIIACMENAYGAEVRYFDDELSRLWADFEKRGLLDDTLVVFYTDHGEQFDEHGRFEHLWDLYVEENASTAAFWSKNIQPRQWTEPTIHQDLAPTILDALGVPLGDHSGVIVGQAPDNRVLVTFNTVYERGQPSIAAIRKNHKLMYWWSGSRRYYDVASDPSEHTNLYDAKDPELLALWDVMGAEIAKTEEIWGLGAVDATP